MKITTRISSAIVVVFMLVSILNVGIAETFAEENRGKYVSYTYSHLDTGSTPTTVTRNEGMIAKVEEFPSASNKSLMIQTQKDAPQCYTDLVYSSSSQCVIEASIAYKGELACQHNIMSVEGPGKQFWVFLRLKNTGDLELGDGTVIGKMQEGVFYDLGLMLDFNTHSYSLNINGLTKVFDSPIPNSELKSMEKVRIHVQKSSSDSEKFYINYFRAYGGTTQMSEAEVSLMSSSVESVPEAPEKVTITDSMVASRMDGNVLMTTKTGRALVENKVVAIDAEYPDVAPKIVDGRTLVPLRFVAEAFGANVEFDDISQTATIICNETTLTVTLGSKNYTVNGEEKTFDVAPYNVDGRMLVPLRAISDALGKQVFWDSCGFIIVGDDAESFSLDNPTDKKILDIASRDLLFDAPTAEDIIADFNKATPDGAHPRLFLTKETIPDLKKKVTEDKYCREWFETVKKNADRYIEAEPLKYQLSGVRLLYVSREAKSRIKSGALVYLLTGDSKYADLAVETLMTVCKFSDWNPYHFLDVAEMSEGVAIGYDWLYDYLSIDQKTLIKEKLINYGLNEIMRDFTYDPTRSRSYKWNDPAGAYPQNWVSVCCGGLSIASLALLGEGQSETQLAAKVISMGMEHVKDLLAAFGPDGAWFEGANYWSYSYEYFTKSFGSYKSILGTDYGLTNAMGFRKGADFMIGLNGNVGTFAMSQASNEPYCNAEFFWLANHFNDPGLSQYRIWFMEKEGRLGDVDDILYFTPEHMNTNSDFKQSLPRDDLFRELIFSVCRTGYEENDMYTVFHGAEDGMGISHLDWGQFVLDLMGVTWACDMGVAGLPYSGGYNWDNYRFRGEGHNTLIFNPSAIDDQNQYAIAPITRYEYNDASAISVTDGTEVHAYKGAKSVIRGYYVDKAEKSVTIQDEIVMDRANSEMYWFMHTRATDIEVSESGRNAVLSSGNVKLLAQLIGDETLKFEKRTATPLPTSPNPSGQEDDSKTLKLTIHSEDITETKFAVKLSLLCGDEIPEDSSEELVDINDWKLLDINLPKLDSISVDGKKLAGFSSDATCYEYGYEAGINGAAPYPADTVSASGDGDIEITYPTEENNVARISVEKDGATNYYYLKLEKKRLKTVQEFDDEMDVNLFVNEKPAFVGKVQKLTEIEPIDVYAKDIPQMENVPENTIDNDFSTRWSSEKLGTMIDFDLGDIQPLTHVGVAFLDGAARSTFYRIAVSEDAENWTYVKNIKSTGTTEELDIYYIGDHNVRYVRLQGYGNTQGSLWFSPTEVAFFAK